MRTFKKGIGYDTKIVFNHAVLIVHWEYTPSFNEAGEYENSTVSILMINDLDKSFFNQTVLEKVAEMVEEKEQKAENAA
jgi:hypothetical protein